MREPTVVCLTCKKRRSLDRMETEITCKRCIEDVREENHRTTTGRVSPRARQLHQRRVSRHGMTVATFAAMKRQQGGGCAICRRIPLNSRGLVIDHNHVTNEVRGLLCFACNSAVGLFQDDPALLAAAIDYLKDRGDYSRSRFRPAVDGDGACPPCPPSDLHI